MFVSSSSAPVASTATADLNDRRYAYWRVRLMYSLIIAYAAFYLVRQNFTIAIPQMLNELGYTKAQVGGVLSAFSIIYGVSKFISGVIADKSNARYLMSAGLLGAALVNICLGFSNTIWTIGLFYTLNGCFQSTGWPSCTRILTRWYGPKNLGTKWALCNVSHQVGAASIVMGAAWLITHYSWRHAFIVPGIICTLLAFFVFERLRDTPESLGLPSIEEKEGLAKQARVNETEENLPLKEIFLKHLLPNKYLWYVCFANFFVYIVRMGFFNWAPLYFKEAKGVSLLQAGGYTTSFEIGGLFGGLAAGWLSDRIFTGFRGRVSFIFMVSVSLGVLFFWLVPATLPWVNILLMSLMGFFIYGPQVLAGVAAAEFGSKKAACAAAGLTGTFGYFGATVAGVGIGQLVDSLGWDAMLFTLVVLGFIGAGLFMMTWNISFLKKA